MSVEPKSSDSLRQLKELMLGDEQRDLADLRARLDGLEADSVERLARDLAEALHRRRAQGDRPFEEWVEALQSGTESAIQRSVSEDKSRLAKALFPIMGPAIRSYVVDLFRGMVEELNETIRNATSVDRIQWRFQALMAGKSYSEYVLLKTRSFRIEEVYLMQRDTGLLLLHAAADPGKGDGADGEADLMSGMLTAIRSFVRDSFVPGEERDEEVHELDSFTFGEREVLMEAGPSMVLAAVAYGVPPPSVREDLKRVLEDLHGELQGRLNRFSGDMRELQGSLPTLRKALLKNQGIASESGGGGGLWRAWVFLGVLAVVLGGWWWIGAREQARWDRFENRLRSEPGMAVTEVEDAGWWRKRLVRGLRDPLAADPATLAAESGIESEKVTFDFGLMASLEPTFVARREAELKSHLESMQSSLDTLRRDVGSTASREGLADLGRRIEEGLSALKSATASEEARRTALADAISEESRQTVEALVRSQFGDVEGLAIAVDGRTVRFSGEVAEPGYSSVLARTKPLEALLSVDVTGLRNGSLSRIAALKEAIEREGIRYADGTLNRDEDQAVERMATMLGEFFRLGAETSQEFRAVVTAHPLIGTLREGNRPIEQSRATQVRDRLVEHGIPSGRLETKLSEDMNRAGQGVTILLTPREAAGGR
ncbi:MAG: hypothetical protein KDM63_00965 [Verrucomicrobiae bacterium]|nr:hypothetical protein [Verrucomicrobiae bacterium]